MDPVPVQVRPQRVLREAPTPRERRARPVEPQQRHVRKMMMTGALTPSQTWGMHRNHLNRRQLAPVRWVELQSQLQPQPHHHLQRHFPVRQENCLLHHLRHQHQPQQQPLSAVAVFAWLRMHRRSRTLPRHLPRPPVRWGQGRRPRHHCPRLPHRLPQIHSATATAMATWFA